jgi:tight adherence protein C
MISPLVIEIGVGVSLVMVGGGALMMRQMSVEKRIESRMRDVQSGRVGTVGKEDTAIKPREAVRMIAGLGQGILKSGVVSGQTVDALTASLEGAGIRSRNAVGIFVAAKLMLAVGLPLVAFVIVHRLGIEGMVRTMALASSAVGGLLAPDYVVRSLRKRYQRAIASGLPDSLDMLVMCAESGLSLEPAIQRVGQEIQAAHPAVGAELLLTSAEFQISTDSHKVLENLGDRTGIAEVRRVVATLSQTLQYGTPLAEALRILSAEMRQEILTRFEEKAARLPVLLTMPMILFILPTLFMVVGGPAIIQAMKLFK